jgi:predicted Zn-dependent protease
MRALDLAGEALRAAEGDEAEAVVLTERSGFARFAAAEVHQPTLIANEVVQLRVVRDGRVGIATTNRADADGLARLAERAADSAESSHPDPDFPGLAPRAEAPEVGGFDDATATLSSAEPLS